MDLNEMSNNVLSPNLNKRRDINILLLGEAGVGKSTFINALANYILLKNYKNAANNKLHILIPAQFTVTDVFSQQVCVNVGPIDKRTKAAKTQTIKTYAVPIDENNTRLRLVDTPGMSDSRNIEQDNVNCENILEYLTQIQELHAICVLIKPTNTVQFQYYLEQILSRLDKSASQNIIFIFTHTRPTHYLAPDASLPLKAATQIIKQDLAHVDIPFERNVFYVENEAFQYLAASQQNVQFSDEARERLVETWKTSHQQCIKLLSYIIGDMSNVGVKPHQLRNSISINETGRIIKHLFQPLADITQLIYENIKVLDIHQNNLRRDKHQSVGRIKKTLYIPILDLEVILLQEPVTVCTSPKCGVIVKTGSLYKKYYDEKCHNPCYLNQIPKEIIGDTSLTACDAMTDENVCKNCTCDFSVHQHIYYMTKTFEKKLKDQITRNNIDTKEAALAEVCRLKQEICDRKTALENELDVIIKSAAQFAHFFQQNAISSFNDTFRNFIEYLLQREQNLSAYRDQEAINHWQKFIKRYDEIKTAFDKTLEYNKSARIGLPLSDTPDFILTTVENLYKLPLYGNKISELLNSQELTRKLEYDKSCKFVSSKRVHFNDNSQNKVKNYSKKQKKFDFAQSKHESSKEAINFKYSGEMLSSYETASKLSPDMYENRQSKNSDVLVKDDITNKYDSQQNRFLHEKPSHRVQHFDSHGEWGSHKKHRQYSSKQYFKRKKDNDQSTDSRYSSPPAACQQFSNSYKTTQRRFPQHSVPEKHSKLSFSNHDFKTRELSNRYPPQNYQNTSDQICMSTSLRSDFNNASNNIQKQFSGYGSLQHHYSSQFSQNLTKPQNNCNRKYLEESGFYNTNDLNNFQHFRPVNCSPPKQYEKFGRRRGRFNPGPNIQKVKSLPATRVSKHYPEDDK